MSLLTQNDILKELNNYSTLLKCNQKETFVKKATKKETHLKTYTVVFVNKYSKKRKPPKKDEKFSLYKVHTLTHMVKTLKVP